MKQIVLWVVVLGLLPGLLIGSCMAGFWADEAAITIVDEVKKEVHLDE